MEKEYTVIVNNRDDLPELEKEITASSGAGPIPKRAVHVANPRLGSRVQTHFMLTDEEAEELRKDPRVRAVELPPEQRDDITIGLRGSQDGNFFRGINDQTDVNWGLRRCIESTNVYGTGTTASGSYVYGLDGTGVDVVIQDSGIDPNHPEWEDATGATRLQQIDWYTASGLPGTQSVNHYRDYDGHGTHCTGITAGKTYGWAKNARIYSQKLSGLEGLGDAGTGISMTDAFDCIRLWHNIKAGSRPTVVNMSWGFSTSKTGAPDSGVYRGTPWTYTAETDTQLWTSYGLVPPVPTDRVIPAQVASIDAEIEDMIADGIHVCIAAGNDYYKADVLGGPDYDNTITFAGDTRYYHRPSSPYSENAFIVGNVESATLTGGVERTRGSSKKGPAVNIWAPGTDIMTTCSTTYSTDYTGVVYDYPDNTAFKIMSIGGTSMASPQVAGLCALHLQSLPELTPAQLQERIINQSQSVLNDTGSITDYTNYDNSIMGSPNRMLFSRYGNPSVQISFVDAVGNITLS